MQRSRLCAFPVLRPGNAEIVIFKPLAAKTVAISSRTLGRGGMSTFVVRWWLEVSTERIRGGSRKRGTEQRVSQSRMILYFQLLGQGGRGFVHLLACYLGFVVHFTTNCCSIRRCKSATRPPAPQPHFPPLVPKLCLGTHSGKLCFPNQSASVSRNGVSGSAFSQTEFGNEEVWERGNTLYLTCRADFGTGENPQIARKRCQS